VNLLEISNASVSRGEDAVLHDIQLTIAEGEHTAILGPNGCGKSTLIKTITRECYPLGGRDARVKVFGEDRWNVFDLRAQMGIVSNDLMTACTRESTALDVVISGFFSSAGHWNDQPVTEEMRDRARAALRSLDAAHLEERLVSELSSGEAKRTLIARALVHSPRALLFDEPSNSLDIAAQRELRAILQRLAQSGITLILVTHHLSDIIPEVGRVVFLQKGRIVADGRKEELLTTSHLSSVFGVNVRLAIEDGYYHLWG
jgi:iron complex transport system ATP-binding protein